MTNKRSPMFFLWKFRWKLYTKIAVPNCPFYNVDAKLSVFTMLVPNCSFLLCWCQIVCLPSWCQIVRFYHLCAKLSGCQIVQPPKYINIHLWHRNTWSSGFKRATAACQHWGNKKLWKVLSMPVVVKALNRYPKFDIIRWKWLSIFIR